MAKSRTSADNTRTPNEAPADHDSTGGVDASGTFVGAVPQSPRTPDESTADDAITTNPAVSEERTPSNASGIPADDPDAGAERRKAYERGATLVSRIG
jgi:hypothetical protein